MARFCTLCSSSSGNATYIGTASYGILIDAGLNNKQLCLAMQRAGKNQDAATIMQSVQTVKEYLSNKMTRRKSPSGRERWQDCMEFLHEAMPEKEFQEYCDQINSVRKAKEGSADHISPDQFIPNPQRNSVPVEQKKADEREEAAEGPGLGRNSV